MGMRGAVFCNVCYEEERSPARAWVRYCFVDKLPSLV